MIFITRQITKSTESVDNPVHNAVFEEDCRVKLANRHNSEQQKICLNSYLQIYGISSATTGSLVNFGYDEIT
jgi:hypothetical protein